MKTLLLSTLAVTLMAAAPSAPLAPSEIVAAAPKADWVAISPHDLMVMTLAPDAKGKARRVVIQLMPAPFSQGWVGNIRTLAAANWWDGTSINRVQDNYVVQWGDASEKKALPTGLVTVGQSGYSVRMDRRLIQDPILHGYDLYPRIDIVDRPSFTRDLNTKFATAFSSGWPIGVERTKAVPLSVVEPVRKGDKPSFIVDTGRAVGFWDLETANIWPLHCYAMVGVGRDMPPNTGTGAELYTVIGHAPRHLDRNIALVGRVIEGIEHLSSLPRGTGALGFYETPEERVGIQSIRIATSLPAPDQPRFEYLSTESASFAAYAGARANRRDAFFIKPAGGADICNIPVPVRRAP